MTKLNLRLEGADKLVKKLNKLGKEAKVLTDGVTRSNAEDIAADASSRAPSNKGEPTPLNLKQSISAQPIDKSNWYVISEKKYAPYVEFGTGTKVDLSTLQKAGFPTSYAAQFKGAGIRQVNIRPQPFFFPAYIVGRRKYIKDLKQLLKRLTK